MGWRPAFSIKQILAWADAFRRRNGYWPLIRSGRIPGSDGDTWRNVDNALRYGLRGLDGRSSLVQMLAERRGARNPMRLPPLTQDQILRWADAHYRRTAGWPTCECGPIRDAPGETWKAIDQALRLGMRTLRGGSSLARLLARRRGVRNLQELPRLTEKQILAWADAHNRRTGVWPTSKSGAIPGTWSETWTGVNAALQKGRRGFPGGSSLARLLARRRGVRNPKQPAPLTARQILRWARAYRRDHGRWPDRYSGAVAPGKGETWGMIDRALRIGLRGLAGNTSLYRLVTGKDG